MKKFVSAAIAALFVILISSSVCFGKDAAMIVDLRGKAFYESGGQQIILMDFLKTGDEIRLKPGAVLILNYFASGIREEITGPGSITIGIEQSSKEGNVNVSCSKTDYLPPKAVLSREDVQQSGATAFRGLGDPDKIVILGDPDKIVILGPADTAVRSHPLFRWKSVRRAESYRFRIYDAQKSLYFETKTFETKTKEINFSYDKLALNEDEDYIWTVSAMRAGKVLAMGNGEFSVLNKKNLEELIRAEKKIKTAFPEDSAELLISLALTYRHYKLYDEAAEIVGKLERLYPGNQNIRNWYQNTISDDSRKNGFGKRGERQE
ncbi:hypothetical protein QUF72_06645 [Desulfobacterales bacterium HSG2]|nr:hypothetical protein [Desulfobacterales bacterium HSG2]